MTITAQPPTTFAIDRRAAGAGCAVPRSSPTSSRAADYDRDPGAGGNYTFTMKPNIAEQLREETVTQAIQTIERRVNELGVAEPIVAPHGSSGDQILVQLPGVTDVDAREGIIRSTALLELKLVEGGPAPTQRERCCSSTAAQVPPDMEVVPGRRRLGRRRRPRGLLPRAAASPADHRPRPADAQADARREQPAGGQLHAEPRRRRQVRQARPATNVGKPLAIVLDHRVQSRAGIEEPISDERPHHRQLHAAGSRRTCR